MLTFSIQEKLLNQILKWSDNNLCADCNSRSPTWASLDFGVFLCSNCSGAHRSLGPTVTRVKSTKLDAWHSDWLQNMKVGNKRLNSYWQASIPLKKPTGDSTLDEIKRFVVQKYIRKKFIGSGQNPFVLYKNGKLSQIKPQKKQIIQIQKKQQKIQSNNNQKRDLLFFSQEKPKEQQSNNDDQFGNYQTSQNTQTIQTNYPTATTTSDISMKFDQLLKINKQKQSSNFNSYGNIHQNYHTGHNYNGSLINGHSFSPLQNHNYHPQSHPFMHKTHSMGHSYQNQHFPSSPNIPYQYHNVPVSSFQNNGFNLNQGITLASTPIQQVDKKNQEDQWSNWY